MGHLYPKSLKGRKLNLFCSRMKSRMKKWKRRGFKGENKRICLCCIQYKMQGKQTRAAGKWCWDVWIGQALNAQANAEIMTWDWSCGDATRYKAVLDLTSDCLTQNNVDSDPKVFCIQHDLLLLSVLTQNLQKSWRKTKQTYTSLKRSRQSNCL